MVQTSDILEIRLKDASYRTYYRIRVPVADKKKIQKIVHDLKILYDLDLISIEKDSKPIKYNIFGEAVDDNDQVLKW